MTKTILASLTGLSSDRTVLEAAVAAARIEGGHIQCLHTRIDAVKAAALIGSASAVRQGNLHHAVQKIAEQEEERSRHAKETFEEVCKRHSLTQRETPSEEFPISISWKETRTFLNETLHEARYHDLTFLARDRELSPERITSVLMQSGRPVLIAPPKPVEVLGRQVAIAWKAGPEAARAVTAASSILARAEKVVILSVSEDKAGDDTDKGAAEYLAKQLQWQGVKAEVRLDYSPPVSAAQAIRDMAYSCDADLLIMGAYGHSRLSEFVFGGVTRDILADCAIPVFLFR